MGRRAPVILQKVSSQFLQACAHTSDFITFFSIRCYRAHCLCHDRRDNTGLKKNVYKRVLLGRI